MAQTVLAFDFGSQRIGIAIGQTLTQTASELAPVSARDGIPHWDALDKVINQWHPDILLVGLPLNMDDSDNETTRRARKFGNRLRDRYKKTLAFMDERLSTRNAIDELQALGKRIDLRNKPVDSMAARLILESWFREQAKT